MNRATGFTLLELLVVLALTALAAAMVAPAATRTLDAWRDASAREEVRSLLQSVPSRARQSGRKWVISTEDDLPEELLALPQGVRFAPVAEWTVHADGRCESTEGTVFVGSRRYALAIGAPFCRVTWRED